MVVVWQTEQAQKCPTCGTFDWEWEEDEAAWSAVLHWCLGCRDIEHLRAETAEKSLHTEGYKIRLDRGGDDGSDTETGPFIGEHY